MAKKFDIQYYFSEGFHSIFTHGFMSFAAVCMIVACLLIMGSFTLVAVNLDNMLGDLEAENEFLAYVDESYTEEQARDIKSQIEAIPNVSQVTFVTRAEAMDDFRAGRENNELLADLPDEVLRDRFRIHVQDIKQLKATSEQVQKITGVADVNAAYDIAQGFVLVRNIATGVAAVLVAMLAVKDYYADYCRPVIIGDLRMFEHGLKVVGGDVPHYVIDDLSQCDWSKGYPVLDLKDQDPDQVVYGEANAYCGAGDLKQLDTAIELCKAGKIEGIVFGPLHKGAMKMAGMHYESEHTYFAHAFDLKTPFCEVNMMDDLMTVRTTSHVPISEVSGMITESSLREAIELGEITGESLGHKPRIAVAALNPHCGEFGLCGREEVDVIQPTIEKVVKETGWNVTGPYSADTLFISALKGDFDVVVTMYHDQGQIALKLVGFQRCITVAGGQPYPIATCAHGTAFDKVGKASVTTDSFERAVRTTAQMALAKRTKANG